MFEWPLDKLDLINSALAQTGDNLVATADDGSEEWKAASPAYERALASMIEQHPWAWTKTVVTLQPAANKPTDNQFDTAYSLPSDLVHLIWVRRGPGSNSTVGIPCNYDLMMGPTGTGPSGVQLVVNSQGGPPPPVPPTTPAVVTIEYVSSTASDPTFATPTFVQALERFVMAGIYRGLHESLQDATASTVEGMKMLDAAKTRHDQQKPKRALFNSRIEMARRVRRPWPRYPSGWGGTGVPN